MNNLKHTCFHTGYICAQEKSFPFDIGEFSDEGDLSGQVGGARPKGVLLVSPELLLSLRGFIFGDRTSVVHEQSPISPGRSYGTGELGHPVFVRGGVLGALGAWRIVLPLRGSAFPDPTRLRGGV